MVISASNISRIALFGGTFDPVHHGHLRSAIEVLEHFAFETVHLIPAHRPPHRDQPQTSSEHRLAMLAAAVEHEPSLIADDREIRREEPSYSVNTIRQFKAEFKEKHGGDCALTWVMGTDALATLDYWHEWPELFSLANVLVLCRPGAELAVPAVVEAKFGLPKTATAELTELSGGFYRLSLSQFEVSASDIRARLQQGRSVSYLVPEKVRQYIDVNELYAAYNG